MHSLSFIEVFGYAIVHFLLSLLFLFPLSFRSLASCRSNFNNPFYKPVATAEDDAFMADLLGEVDANVVSSQSRSLSFIEVFGYAIVHFLLSLLFLFPLSFRSLAYPNP
jgi:hypothetical protein